MKVKEVDRTANIAWSPQPQVPIYLAAGTAAQQLDASFSTNSNLEIYGLNLSETGHDMPCLASLPVEQRFHRVVWGGVGIADGSMASGLLVGGADRGMITMYNADKLIKGEADALVFSQDKHTGPVAALDFNPFQANLMASGGSESELYIWDVNKLGSPMTPGAKSQPLDDVRSVAWNRQVQHIMASSFASRCVVWDLRKNDPIIKVSDSTSRARYKVVSWHPDVATQLCLASEDDHTPIIQIWDLRQASSPMKVLEGHHKGVLSVAWCQADSDLLLSCGKDNRILVWNPNQGAGEVVAELPTSNQWSFEVSWCPRNPAVIASASFDGHVSLYSLMGGQQQAQPTNRITESFGPGTDLAQGSQGPPVTMQLKTPPKWLRRPCGATFGFGGQLVTFETPSGGQPSVYVSRVVTEPTLVEDSAKLEVSLEQGNYLEFCEAKLAGLEGTSNKAQLWQFIRASFGEDATSQYMNLLGINFSEIRDKLAGLLAPPTSEPEVEAVAQEVEGLGITGSGDEFDMIAAQAQQQTEVSDQAAKPSPLDLAFGLGQDEPLTLALLAGDLSLAVDICIKEERFAEALILAIRGGGDLLVSTQAKYFKKAAENVADRGGSAALVEAVALSSWDRLVENCSLASWREVLAVLVTYTDLDTRQTLAARLADRLSASEGGRAEAMLCYVVAGSLDRVVECWMQVEGGSEAVPSTASSLQELVEVVVMVRAAVQARGMHGIPTPGGGLSVALASYAALLAAQGSLATALVYLGDVQASQDTELGQLKERLERALARPPVQQQRKVSGGRGVDNTSQLSLQRKMSGQMDSRRSSTMEQPPAQFTNFNTGPVANSGYSLGSNMPYNPPPVAPSQPQYTGFNPGQPSQAPSLVAPPVEPVQTFPPQPPANQPPAAPSTAPSNPLLRRNRAVDPSIGAGGGGSNMSYNYMQPQPSQHFGQPYAEPAQPAPNMFTPEPVQQPGLYNPAPTQPAANPALPPPALNVNTPDHGGPGWTPAVSSGSGWNDPPPMVSRRPTAATLVTDSVPEPVPQPTFFTPEPLPAPSAQPWAGFQPAANAQFQQPAPQGPPQGFQGFQPQEPAPAAPLAAPVPEAAPPAPIPSEHQVIQDVLENLRSKCQQAAAHPQVRRKLEDVSSKLDILYNKLRAASLSAATLQGLHTILQHIWQYDYPSCMQVISGLIAGGSFAEMSDFMPGVKVLLQVAQQQGVYVEYQQ